MDAIEVRHSPRARLWRLEAPWGELARLTVPERTSRAEVARILAEKRSWIEEQRRRGRGRGAGGGEAGARTAGGAGSGE